MSNRNHPLLLLLVVFFILGCEAELPKEDNSWNTDNLKGKVKRLMEITYAANRTADGWGKGQQGPVFIIKSYTENGFLISERNYYSDSNQPAGGFNYIYDQNYNLLRVETVDQEEGIVGYSNVEERQGKVSILRYNEYFGTGEGAMLTNNTDMTWDGNLLMQAATFEPNGEKITSNDYTYDEKGNLTSFSVNTIKPEERYIKMLLSYQAFDDQGNWTRMLREFQGLPQKEVVEREYEYYD